MAPLKGVHRVRISLASSRAEYWYAWRGGPKILSESAPTDAALDRLVAAAAAKAGEAYHAAHAVRTAPMTGFLAGLIQMWKASPEFAKLGERDRADLHKHLAVVSRDLGTMPVAALRADGARKVLLDWRLRYQGTPRTADFYMTAIARLLAWARDNGETAADPLREWTRLYSVDRSDIVWTAEEIEAVCAAAEAEPELQRAILVAAYSGLRQGDLLRLTWTAIGKEVITRRTKKRNRVVDIPITATLRTVLDACPTGGLYVLTKDGKAWKASTLAKRWGIARAKAAKKLPSIVGKRWHDLRGTYATELVRSGVEDEKVDRIMGWKKGNSEQTRASYVTGDVVAHLAIARLKKAA